MKVWAKAITEGTELRWWILGDSGCGALGLGDH